MPGFASKATDRKGLESQTHGLALFWRAERRGQGRALHAAPRMQRLIMIYHLPKLRPDGQTVLSLTPLEFEAYIPVLAGDLLSLRPRRQQGNPWPWLSDASRSWNGWRRSSRHHAAHRRGRPRSSLLREGLRTTLGY